MISKKGPFRVIEGGLSERFSDGHGRGVSGASADDHEPSLVEDPSPEAKVAYERGLAQIHEGYMTMGLRSLEQAAEYGHGGACLKLSGFYFWDPSSPHHNLKKSLIYLQKSGELGHPDGMWGLALYYSPRGGVTPDTGRYMHYLERASLCGVDEAALQSAQEYYEGAFVRKDWERARAHYMGAACTSLLDAQYPLSYKITERLFGIAEAYKNGEHGLPQDYSKVVEIYQYLKPYDSFAAYKLGNMYREGLGVNSNPVLALYHILSARNKAELYPGMDVFLCGEALDLAREISARVDIYDQQRPVGLSLLDALVEMRENAMAMRGTKLPNVELLIGQLDIAVIHLEHLHNRDALLREYHEDLGFD